MRSLPILLGALAALPAAAQTPQIAPAPSVLFAASAAEAPPALHATTDTALSRDPREVGAGLGVMAGFAAVYGLGRLNLPAGCPTAATASCPDRWHPGVGGYLVGAAIGGVAGYAIGRLINGPYHRPTPPPATLPKDKGVKAWQGALVGAGVGAFALPILMHGFHLDRGGDGDAPIVLIPVGAVIGAFVGAGSAME